MEPSREGFLEVMSRFRIRRFNQAKVERAFQAREKGEQETEVEKQHGIYSTLNIGGLQVPS